MKKPEETLELQINRHHLSGVKRRGKWLFSCQSWPELEQQHDGDKDASGMIDAFVQRAIVGAVIIREMTKS
jgi:hypothetical protein